MSEAATATITASQLDASTWQYSITLNDTGSTTVGTFWFGWIPAEDFLATNPVSVTNPTGWADAITHFPNSPSNGFAIQWTTSSALMQPGSSLGFSFTSSDTPSSVFGNSVFYPTTPVLTSFVYSGAPFSDAGFRFVVTACFRSGTKIRTPNGDIAVENIREGDEVLTLSGTPRTVVWLGYRSIDCRRYKTPEQVWPVRIMRGALSDDLPQRDVYLSPDHAIFVDGILIPAKHLINGKTIQQVRMDEVNYYHIELERHDVVFAEGLPTESYLDTGDRAKFANNIGPTLLHPDFTALVREVEGCAPLVVAGRRLATVREGLAARATGNDSAMNPIVAAK